MARTKIVATIGPSSADEATIRLLIGAGMNVARMNFSHGTQDWHRETVALLRKVAEEERTVLAILGDLQGPKLRLGNVQEGGINLNLGEELLLTRYRGQPNMLHLPHPELMSAIRPGARLVFGDGEMEVQVTENRGDVLVCTVTVPGLLEARKGVNAPGTQLPLSSITDKDRDDLRLVCELDLDFVALSFVRTADDIEELRGMMEQYDAKIPIIAKIEKAEAIQQLAAISLAADGMMVARGDLGIDMPPQEVPLLQKRIIRVCNEAGKPVITATQMLQSMVDHPRPTRAEASDVANAILDGTDAVMLSAESASGKYPVESVQMMIRIATIIESAFPYNEWQQRRRGNQRDATDRENPSSVTAAISTASVAIAEIVDARAIVTSTMSGYTARQIARHRPIMEILAVSPQRSTQRRLALTWGVQCETIESNYVGTDNMLAETVSIVRSCGFRKGERVVITAGIPFGQTGKTNLIKVHEIGDPVG